MFAGVVNDTDFIFRFENDTCDRRIFRNNGNSHALQNVHIISETMICYTALNITVLIIWTTNKDFINEILLLRIIARFIMTLLCVLLLIILVTWKSSKWL